MAAPVTARRVMGTEIEYGIAVPGLPHMNSMVLSAQIVGAYAGGERSMEGGTRWDFEEEHPLRDARGIELPPALQETLEGVYEDPGLLNAVLTNGARLYVDHAHPEYSTPEVTHPLAAVLHERAGELIMLSALRRTNAVPGTPQVNLYKNNTDNKGASYGAHENYLVDRSVPFASLVRHMTPFFVTRQIFAGAGRVGRGQEGRGLGFQLSQRADFMEAEVGLETTVKRPIINTRDEPHADPAMHRRFHVIVGDANMSQLASFLKLGTTSLVLGAIEAGGLDGLPEIADPVREIQEVSHDHLLQHRIRLSDGRRMTALEIQDYYLEAITAAIEAGGLDSSDGGAEQVVHEWGRVLNILGDDPLSLAGELDWPAKLNLLEGYRRRGNLDWDDPKLALIDLQYHDIRPEKGLYHTLVTSGRMRTLVTDEQAEEAVLRPPEDTRAWFRGECLRRFADSIFAASWDSIVFDIAGRDALQRIATSDPLKGTKQHVGAVLDRSKDAAALVDALQPES